MRAGVPREARSLPISPCRTAGTQLMATDVILGRAFMGLVGSDAERKALLALAESVPGVSRVADEMIPAY
jgi:hypothetical protein